MPAPHSLLTFMSIAARHVIPRHTAPRHAPSICFNTCHYVVCRYDIVVHTIAVNMSCRRRTALFNDTIMPRLSPGVTATNNSFITPPSLLSSRRHAAFLPPAHVTRRSSQQTLRADIEHAARLRHSRHASSHRCRRCRPAFAMPIDRYASLPRRQFVYAIFADVARSDFTPFPLFVAPALSFCHFRRC